MGIRSYWITNTMKERGNNPYTVVHGRTRILLVDIVYKNPDIKLLIITQGGGIPDTGCATVYTRVCIYTGMYTHGY